KTLFFLSSFPLCKTHLSGLNSLQSCPHISSILPIEYMEIRTLVFFSMKWPLGSISRSSDCFVLKGPGGYSLTVSLIAPWRYTILFNASMLGIGSNLLCCSSVFVSISSNRVCSTLGFVATSQKNQVIAAAMVSLPANIKVNTISLTSLQSAALPRTRSTSSPNFPSIPIPTHLCNFQTDWGTQWRCRITSNIKSNASS
ncbi:hypothetical protein LINPERPRIM_LOCUS32154, partial [Linum perenne]